mgnify:CR=1 FL=1
MYVKSFPSSSSRTTRGWVNNSTVAFAPTAFTLKRLKTAVAVFVIVTVMVSAFPLSSETSIDLIIAVVAAGAV